VGSVDNDGTALYSIPTNSAPVVWHTGCAAASAFIAVAATQFKQLVTFPIGLKSLVKTIYRFDFLCRPLA